MRLNETGHLNLCVFFLCLESSKRAIPARKTFSACSVILGCIFSRYLMKKRSHPQQENVTPDNSNFQTSNQAPRNGGADTFRLLRYTTSKSFYPQHQPTAFFLSHPGVCRGATPHGGPTAHSPTSTPSRTHHATAQTQRNSHHRASTTTRGAHSTHPPRFLPPKPLVRL